MPGAAVRVLVVDDFRAFRQWVRSKLETQQNFKVAGEAGNALEGIQKAQKLTPDLIVLDIGLPDINGIEAARELCRLVPSAKVLFLSGHADQDMVKVALSNGAKGYVLKSEAARELLPALETILRGGKFVGRGVKPLGENSNAQRNPQIATLT